ncbi:MAG TPA: hypothetical protein VNG33_01700 [Polyangiaceae bacterium]|nr:hypothetical protein [Polyangiaceae bacterium]
MPPESANRGPDWELYAAHRARFTDLVLAAAPSGTDSPPRLCVLGAGRCNDLDLSRLAAVYGELHLVDIEPALLASAVSREDAALRSKLVPHAPVDLAVLSAKRAGKWQRRTPSAAELDAAASATLHGLLARLPGPFDVLVSACVLTQLGFALTQTFRESHPLLGPLRVATARTHLQTLVELTAPRGSALFVSDLASSSHYPLDTLPQDAKLDQVLVDVVDKRAFYHLAAPDLVRGLLEEVAPERELGPISPWLWTGPLARTYLVYGFKISGNSATA